MLERFHTFKSPVPSETDKERVVIRAHKEYLINHRTTIRHVIDTRHSVPEIHNWYRYLKLIGYPENSFYAIFVMNDITDHMSLDSNTKTILLPKLETLEEIKNSII